MGKRHAQAILVVVLIGAAILGPWVIPFLHRHEYRAEVRSLSENLHLGLTKEQVRNEMDQGKYPDLDFYQEGELWLATAPLEFGAGNWALRIEFQDDVVSAVRIRIADGSISSARGPCGQNGESLGVWSKIAAWLTVAVLIVASLWCLNLTAFHTWAAGFPNDREWHFSWAKRLFWSLAQRGHLLAVEQPRDEPETIVFHVTLLPGHAPSSGAKCRPCLRNKLSTPGGNRANQVLDFLAEIPSLQAAEFLELHGIVPSEPARLQGQPRQPHACVLRVGAKGRGHQLRESD